MKTILRMSLTFGLSLILSITLSKTSTATELPPGQLPPSPLSERGALEFAPKDNTGRAPLAAMLTVNGKRPTAQEQAVIFQEGLWVNLPPKAPILVKQNGPKEHWRYPVGTELFHEIRVRTEAGSLPFELRMVRKEPDESWSFTTYTSGNSGTDPWKKLDSEQATLPTENLSITHPTQGALELTWRRIHPRNCKNCHSMRVDREQFPTLSSVGPCEFTSENPQIRTEWARRFEEVRGFSPFLEANEDIKPNGASERSESESSDSTFRSPEV